MSKIDVICDYSHKALTEVPVQILQLCNLKMLYLEGNLIGKLPDVLFQKLPKLSWLDLRNNNLQTFPRTVAHHEHLENLLLSNNEITTLPIELGLVPNLKVLLISGNPIVYPPQEVVEKSTPAICSFLREEYEKARKAAEKPPPPPPPAPPCTNSPPPKTIKANRKKTKTQINLLDLLRQPSIPTISAKPRVQLPTISVKGLSKISEILNIPELGRRSKQTCHSRKTHKVSKCCSKISVHSHFNIAKHVGAKKSTLNTDKFKENELGELWLAKLKELIHDQEKLLQQEKNLRALTNWRTKKKMEPQRAVSPNKGRKTPPYDTDPDYDTMASRKELACQIDKMIKKSSTPTEKVDLKYLIDEVVSQLKNLETSCEEVKSPRTEIENAGRQIQTILQLHKKIVKAQNMNKTS